MAYIISVANQKGGVAKTTTVVSLGGALAQTGKQVLLIDLNSQADLTLALGLDQDQVRCSMADVLLNSGNMLSITQETAIPGIDLIPSNDEMELTDQFLPLRENYEYLLKKILISQLPSQAYDVIILDCPHNLGAVTRNAIVTANLLIIPIQPEHFSIQVLRNMLVTIQHIRNNCNPQLVHRILITMRDRRSRIHRTLCDQIQANYTQRLFDTVIDIDTQLIECTIAGLPITHFTPKTRSAIQYQSLAQELTQNVRGSFVQYAT